MKKPTSLLFAGLVVLCSPLLNAQGTTSAAPKASSAVTPSSTALIGAKPAVAAQAEPTLKEMLAAINAKLDRLEGRVAAIEVAHRTQFEALKNGVQVAFNQVGEEIGNIQLSLTELKAATKAAAPPAAAKPR